MRKSSRGNPYHDEKGKFTTANGCKIKSELSVDEYSKRDEDRVIKNHAEKVGISEDEARKAFNDTVANNLRGTGKTEADIEHAKSEAVRDFLSREYENKLSVKVEDIDKVELEDGEYDVSVNYAIGETYSTKTTLTIDREGRESVTVTTHGRGYKRTEVYRGPLEEWQGFRAKAEKITTFGNGYTVTIQDDGREVEFKKSSLQQGGKSHLYESIFSDADVVKMDMHPAIRQNQIPLTVQYGKKTLKGFFEPRGKSYFLNWPGYTEFVYQGTPEYEECENLFALYRLNYRREVSYTKD